MKTSQMQSQTFQKLNRIVFKFLAVLINSNLIQPLVMEDICSTGLIRVKAMSETESWLCHQLCSGFFAYCAMDCCVDLLEKAKKHCSFCMI